jgi:hypothetical protein
MNKSLKSRAPRFSVHAPGDASTHAEEESTAAAIEIDWGALGK